MNFIIALTWVVARLKEPSTYAGISGLLTTYHLPHAADLAPLIINILISAASIAAIFLPEKRDA